MTSVPAILNVVSGKGGSGKSLACATLGRLLKADGHKVLLVDLDIFVRGLTYFYYLYVGEVRRITKSSSVADFFECENNDIEGMCLGVEEFFELHIIPAVSEVEEEINYIQVERDTKKKVARLYDLLRKQGFDVIIIDNRAGIDDLIIETSVQADVTISVSESDPIARITNYNLVRQLEKSNAGKVYTVLNKVRSVDSYEEYRRTRERYVDFQIMGTVPFDLEVFQNFGDREFWYTANQTRFTFGISEAWNRISRREELPYEIDMERFSGQAADIWPKSATFPLYFTILERLAISASLVMFITALVPLLLFGVFGMEWLTGIRGVIAERAVPVISGVFMTLGLTMLATVIFRRAGKRKTH